MKKILIACIGSLMVLGATAQQGLDRSQRPKPGPAPVISFKDPVMYTLPNGIILLVVENHTLPKVSATYSIDAGPITEGNKAGVTDLMGNMLNEGTTSMSKAQFDEAVDQMGADVNLSAGGGSVSALTRYFDKAFGLMTDALEHPLLSQESFDKLKSQLLTEIKSNEKSAKAISGNVVGALSYGLDNPLGEFVTTETVNNITLDDVKKAYAQYITPSRGYLTVVGDITPAQAKALAEKTMGSWKGNALKFPELKKVNNPSATEVDLVDVPNAVQSEITVTNLIDLPMSSPDYFAVLLANQILGGGANAKLFMNLRERHGFTYGSYSGVNAGRYQTRFSATASVRNDKVDSAVAEILHEIDTIRTVKVSAAELANAKAIYNGSFALGLENPARTAGFASNILINKLPKDFYRTYLQKINAVTPDDIQRVAQKYFNYANTRVVVVGKADVVQKGLTALGYPVKMYDKNAKPVEAKSTTAVNITADAVVAKYVEVAGGAAALKAVNSVVETGHMSLQGMDLDFTEKSMAPNKELVDITMGGQVVVHQMFDGSTGYAQQMGNKQDMSADDIAEKKETPGIFPQAFYKEAGFKMEMGGIDKLSGGDAYKIQITSPSGKKSTEWYDVASGFLVKESSTTTQDGQDVEHSSEFSDYRKVGNIMVPYKTAVSVSSAMGSQDFTIELTDIKLNEGVTAEDFK